MIINIMNYIYMAIVRYSDILSSKEKYGNRIGEGEVYNSHAKPVREANGYKIDIFIGNSENLNENSLKINYKLANDYYYYIHPERQYYDEYDMSINIFDENNFMIVSDDFSYVRENILEKYKYDIANYTEDNYELPIYDKTKQNEFHVSLQDNMKSTKSGYEVQTNDYYDIYIHNYLDKDEISIDNEDIYLMDDNDYLIKEFNCNDDIQITLVNDSNLFSL